MTPVRGQFPAVSPDALRTILVGAFEEDSLVDLLRTLTDTFGSSADDWLAAVQAEARLGRLDAYRYSTPDAACATTFLPVDLGALALSDIGPGYRDAVYLTRTEATIPAIRALPPPPPSDSLWVTGLWGAPGA